MEMGIEAQKWLWGWLVIIAILFWHPWTKHERGIGLVFAYLLNLWVTHWPGAFIQILPWYSSSKMDVVEVGFIQSSYGMIAFIAGALLFRPILGKWLNRQRFQENGEEKSSTKATMNVRLPSIYIFIGLVSYLVLVPLLHGLPTVTAFISATIQLLIVGLCLGCWRSWQINGARGIINWLIASSFLPIGSVLFHGFLGYGVSAFLVVLCFLAMIFKPRWILLIVAAIIGYIGFSVYVTYMRDREEIREIVWGGEALSQRVERIATTFKEFEWFDIYNYDHLTRVDTRLNQTFLIGAAVLYLDEGGHEFAKGETLLQAVTALVPRVIWRDKPVRAGSPELVSTYTGQTFAEGTSVGIGQVMEFYINFGTKGVVIGFLILGFLISLFDQAAFQALTDGNWRRFTIWQLAGIGFLQVGGSLVEVTATVGSSIGTAIIVNRYVLPIFLKESQMRSS